eukprot:1412952-Pleurochrysis_carterae.AAC.2
MLQGSLDSKCLRAPDCNPRLERARNIVSTREDTNRARTERTVDEIRAPSERWKYMFLECVGEGGRRQRWREGGVAK